MVRANEGRTMIEDDKPLIPPADAPMGDVSPPEGITAEQPVTAASSEVPASTPPADVAPVAEAAAPTSAVAETPEAMDAKAVEEPVEEEAEITVVGKRSRGLWRLVNEQPVVPIFLDAKRLRRQSRRDFLLFGAGVAAAAAGLWWVLPDGTKQHFLSPERVARLDTLAMRVGASAGRRERFLDGVLTFDDDVAEALYSRERRVRTYRTSDLTPLRNNYSGRTPSAAYIPSWKLTLSGLASGRNVALAVAELRALPQHEQITRICCVEGWSAVAWWGGVLFADLLAAFPPAPGMRWAALESAVNLDGAGNPDPYYVSIDLETARHPQGLLALEQNRRPLTVEHGAPLRLVVPMKLGLKNIKAITAIRYSAAEPADYWNERGYSKYDGL
jgi:DMSO/TMAO reductase YedYZ molybdopterin-dependent catalytic subunit